MIRASESLSYVVAGPFNARVKEQLRACSSVVEVARLPRRPARTWLRLPWLILVLLFQTRRRPDVLLANGLTEAAVSVPAALLYRCPLVVWVHNYELPVVARVMGPLLRSHRVDVRWIAVSALAGRISAPVRGWRSYELVSNPIDEEAVRSLGSPVEDGVFRVGYLGSARDYKGYDLLPAIVDATSAKTSRPVEWLLFTGRGARPEIDRALDERANVHRLAPVFPQREAFARLDAVICPSREESFGRVVAEAMYNGLPVVASDIPAFAELLSHQAEVALFPVGQAAEAGRIVGALAEEPSLRHSMGRQNAAVAERFTVDRVLPDLEAVLHAAADVG